MYYQQTTNSLLVYFSLQKKKGKQNKNNKKKEKQSFPHKAMENLTSFPPRAPNSNTGVCVLPKKRPQDRRSCDRQDDSKSYEHSRRAFSMFQQHQISRAKVTVENFSGLSWGLFYLHLGPVPPSHLVQV